MHTTTAELLWTLTVRAGEHEPVSIVGSTPDELTNAAAFINAILSPSAVAIAPVQVRQERRKPGLKPGRKAAPKAKTVKRKTTTKQNVSAVSAAWDQARELAAKKKITLSEARRQLKQARAIAAAANKSAA